MLLEDLAFRMESYFNRTSETTEEPNINEAISIIADYSVYAEGEKNHHASEMKYFFLATGAKKITLLSMLELVKNKFRNSGHADEEMESIYKMLERFCDMAIHAEDITDGCYQIRRFYELLGSCFVKKSLEKRTNAKEENEVSKYMFIEMERLSAEYKLYIDDTAKKVYSLLV